MFDLLGKSWEYEPIDLPGWIPDFRLSPGHLVEVCPFATLDDHVAKIVRSRAWEVRGPDGCPEGAIIDILTEDPLVWWGSVGGRPFEKAVHGDPKCDRTPACRMLAASFRKRTLDLWKEAGNRTQWRGAGATP
jgi:hypothetical protein